MPAILIWRNGNPGFSNQHGIIERLAEMSEAYGTKITVDDRGYGIVELSKKIKRIILW